MRLNCKKKLDHFPDDFNQLDLLETHRHLIPTGTQSHWPGESEEDEEERTEEWYQTQEENLKDNHKELILFALENNRSLVNGHLAIVRELIAKGADVRTVTVDGWTPLHSACKWNNTELASFLLQHGTDINAQTKGSLTPLHLAAANRDCCRLLELLLMNRYIKPQLTNKLGETAYEIARRTDMYHYLFEIADYWT
ncbi:ankyrin repeat domain-containing protein 49-like [Bufo bufo]|uniref:ankyrin repeat domain-containing protein 49-like n=1 Tax=Bufo bufo TaxID=8384 RepID=UPI001ABE93EB|nr:ankyrin repeat domain-containing protein 49-like [Bufo bufo]